MTTMATPSRAELVDRWVLEHAASLVIANLALMADDVGDLEDVAGVIDGELFDRLFPDEEEPGAVEQARTCALAASLMAQLATDQCRDHMLRESARLSAFAASDLAKAAHDAG